MLVLGCFAGATLCPAAEWMRQAPSAFLRASADTPVDWQPWTPEVLARAKRENRPVYVFIGSFLNELSRATFKQSFSNAEAAAFLNANFICIVVDQEERPDLAAEAQLYLEEVKQLSGWPAHLWLTPELQPYEGASYLPPSEEWGKVSFLKTAQGAQSAWATDKAGCRRRGGEAVSSLAAATVAAGERRPARRAHPVWPRPPQNGRPSSTRRTAASAIRRARRSPSFSAFFCGRPPPIAPPPWRRFGRSRAVRFAIRWTEDSFATAPMPPGGFPRCKRR